MSAILALSGVYVYDYTRSPKLIHQINACFREAETRFAQLLCSRTTWGANKSELISLAVLLLMQDVSGNVHQDWHT